ncbi:MAG: hypothetical protein ABJC74_13235, partial [Gemmatimonadota bacterium]
MLRLLRSPLLRSLTLVVQLLALGSQLVEGTGAMRCPHHDLGAASPHMGMLMAMGMDHGHDGHSSDSHNHGCRCLGDCSSGLVVLPAPDVAALPDVAAHRAELPFVISSGSRAPQFRLPPAL